MTGGAFQIMGQNRPSKTYIKDKKNKDCKKKKNLSCFPDQIINGSVAIVYLRPFSGCYGIKQMSDYVGFFGN